MAKLTATTFVSLDGVMQAPGGPEEDTDGGFALGGWVMPLFSEELGAFMDEVFLRATAFVLGRRTYDTFAGAWPQQSGDPVADALNSLPKYVATRSQDTLLDWQGSAVLQGGAADAVRRLKSESEGELQIHGSAGLLQSLHPLVDEYNLIVFPVILGGGKRLFEDGAMPGELTLADRRATANGVTMNIYRRSGEVRQASAGD